VFLGLDQTTVIGESLEFARLYQGVEPLFTLTLYNFPVIASSIDQWPESR
jgi:hypothetical protein